MEFIPLTKLLFSFIMSLILIIDSLTAVDAIKCFQCTQTPPSRYSNKTTRLCPSFDYSDHYMVDCPYSTMCMKKSYEYETLKGKVISLTRDCASQRYKFQQYSKGKWELAYSIEEPYEEGCKTEPAETGKGAEYCYCRGHLCNSATQTDKAGYHTDAMAVIFVFNAMKYLSSTR